MTVSIIQLWPAILLSGALCWIVSSLVHMVFKYHQSDYTPLDNESDVLEILGASSPKPALYTMPYCHDMKEMADEAMQKKFQTGPVAMISVLPNGMPPMGKLLGQQILFFLLGSLLIAYLTSLSLISGAPYMEVFWRVFVAAFLAYGWAQVPYSIWMGQPWANCFRYFIDAILYASVTAGAFAWLWPS